MDEWEKIVKGSDIDRGTRRANTCNNKLNVFDHFSAFETALPSSASGITINYYCIQLPLSGFSFDALMF